MGTADRAHRLPPPLTAPLQMNLHSLLSSSANVSTRADLNAWRGVWLSNRCMHTSFRVRQVCIGTVAAASELWAAQRHELDTAGQTRQRTCYQAASTSVSRTFGYDRGVERNAARALPPMWHLLLRPPARLAAVRTVAEDDRALQSRIDELPHTLSTHTSMLPALHSAER